MTTPTPSSKSAKAPSGVKLTKAGTTLKVGQSARVQWAANPSRISVLTLSVTGIRHASQTDFAAYDMPSQLKKAHAYYVSYRAKNIGSGKLGGLGVPLLGVSSSGKDLQAAGFSNSFAKCPSTGLPSSFDKGQQTLGCLVFLVASPDKLTGVTFAPTGAEGVTWKGSIGKASAKPMFLKHGKPPKK